MFNAGNNDMDPRGNQANCRLSSAEAGHPGPGVRGAGCDTGETTACGEALRFVSLRDSEFVSVGMITAKHLKFQ